MAGGMFAGHDQSGGELIEKDGKKYKLFYGMSSSTAMEVSLRVIRRRIHFGSDIERLWIHWFLETCWWCCELQSIRRKNSSTSIPWWFECNYSRYFGWCPINMHICWCCKIKRTFKTNNFYSRYTTGQQCLWRRKEIIWIWTEDHIILVLIYCKLFHIKRSVDHVTVHGSLFRPL